MGMNCLAGHGAIRMRKNDLNISLWSIMRRDVFKHME